MTPGGCGKWGPSPLWFWGQGDSRFGNVWKLEGCDSLQWLLIVCIWCVEWMLLNFVGLKLAWCWCRVSILFPAVLFWHVAGSWLSGLRWSTRWKSWWRWWNQSFHTSQASGSFQTGRRNARGLRSQRILTSKQASSSWLQDVNFDPVIFIK